MSKKIYSFEYKGSRNLGDEIQTIAAIRLIRELGYELGGVVDRNTVDTDEPINLLCNGFFDIKFLHNLFKDNVNPIFSNIHIARDGRDLKPELVEQFLKHEPIGCRDRETMQYLQSKGIKCFFNYCLTATLPRREKVPQDGKTLVVNLKSFLTKQKCRANRNHVEYLTQEIVNKKCPHATKMRMAQQLLDRYKNEASLIITSRLHCALPCIAMGIPVIYFTAPNEISRQELIKEFILMHPYTSRFSQMYWLISYYRKKKFKNFATRLRLNGWCLYSFFQHKNKVDWNPPSLDIEATKQQIIDNTAKLIQDKAR